MIIQKSKTKVLFVFPSSFFPPLFVFGCVKNQAFAPASRSRFPCFIHYSFCLHYNRSIPTKVPALVARIASIPPAGNPIARPASFGFELAVASAGDVGEDPEVGEPAPAEALELAEDAALEAASVAALESPVSVAGDSVAIALALAGSVMYSPLVSMYE